MKLLNYWGSITLMIVLMSCSSSNETKEIRPTSTEFTSGELAKLIEVVDEPCQLSYAEKDGTIATQYIKLKVKLRVTKESPDLQKVDAQDIHFTKLLSVATINLVDENETKVQDLDVKSEDMLKLKKLLQKEKGAEETITFEGEFHNSDDAPKWFKEAAAFTPYLTGDVIAGDVEVAPASSSFDVEGIHDLHGTIDKYPITMHLEIEGAIVKGVYYYDKQGPDAELKLSGSNEDGILDLNETDANGAPTGHFRGKFINGVYSGQFVTNQSKKMPFIVSKGNAVNDDLSINLPDDEDVSSDDDFTTGDGDESVDEFLNEYEKFWRTYIKYMKKMDRNDPTAMIEYTKLLQQFNDYNTKLEKMKGKMSLDQLNRINKMNTLVSR